MQIQVLQCLVKQWRFSRLDITLDMSKVVMENNHLTATRNWRSERNRLWLRPVRPQFVLCFVYNLFSVSCNYLSCPPQTVEVWWIGLAPWPGPQKVSSKNSPFNWHCCLTRAGHPHILHRLILSHKFDSILCRLIWKYIRYSTGKTCRLKLTADLYANT